jgi:hypothetical protein
MRRLLLLATLILTACSPVPSPTPMHSPAPSSSRALPSPSTAGAPLVMCEPEATDASGSPIPHALTCENAVAAAEAIVGPVPGIAYIEFRYGRWCPPGRYCAITTDTDGHVIFHVHGLRPDILVQVHVDDAGQVVAESPLPLPSPLPSPSS